MTTTKVTTTRSRFNGEFVRQRNNINVTAPTRPTQLDYRRSWPNVVKESSTTTVDTRQTTTTTADSDASTPTPTITDQATWSSSTRRVALFSALSRIRQRPRSQLYTTPSVRALAEGGGGGSDAKERGGGVRKWERHFGIESSLQDAEDAAIRINDPSTICSSTGARPPLPRWITRRGCGQATAVVTESNGGPISAGANVGANVGASSVMAGEASVTGVNNAVHQKRHGQPLRQSKYAYYANAVFAAAAASSSSSAAAVVADSASAAGSESPFMTRSLITDGGRISAGLLSSSGVTESSINHSYSCRRCVNRLSYCDSCCNVVSSDDVDTDSRNIITSSCNKSNNITNSYNESSNMCRQSMLSVASYRAEHGDNGQSIECLNCDNDKNLRCDCDISSDVNNTGHLLANIEGVNDVSMTSSRTDNDVADALLKGIKLDVNFLGISSTSNIMSSSIASIRSAEESNSDMSSSTTSSCSSGSSCSSTAAGTNHDSCSLQKYSQDALDDSRLPCNGCRPAVVMRENHDDADSSPVISRQRRREAITKSKLKHRSIDDLEILLEHFLKQTQAVSEELVSLLQERHDIQQQVDMRKIAVEQLQAMTSHSTKPLAVKQDNSRDLKQISRDKSRDLKQITPSKDASTTSSFSSSAVISSSGTSVVNLT